MDSEMMVQERLFGVVDSDGVFLEVCRRSDERYQDIRDRHYVKNSGTHGQQIHFIVHYNREVVGIISGASSVYSVKARDDFFGFPTDTAEKQSLYLPAIINNTVFRLEHHQKNLATMVLSKWRKVIADLWLEIYGVPVIGFETFVVENDTRKGTLYKADNWTYVGETQGSTKKHSGLKSKSVRLQTEKKMIYCRWRSKPCKPKIRYVSSWKNETEAEVLRNRTIREARAKIVGRVF